MKRIESALILCGSPKQKRSSSRELGEYLARRLEVSGVKAVVRSCVPRDNLLADVGAADLLVLSLPLYADGIPARMAHAERLVYFCPVVFGGFAPRLKRVIERSISLLLPFMRVYHGELHHPMRYARQYELCGVGILNRPDPEAAASFRERIRRLSLNFNGARFSAGALVRDETLDAARIRGIVNVREEI